MGRPSVIFKMAMAHGAGLMIAPSLLSVAAPHGAYAHHHEHVSAAASGLNVSLGILFHTFSMLAVMAIVAWFVYRYVGLAVLRRRWVNFDLIWAVALLVVGGVALLSSTGLI